MTLCPIALAVTCRKCAIVKICPVKTVIGDYVASETSRPAAKAKSKQKQK